ncbi:MAG: peptidase S8, partial [Chloroflexi bacterium]
MLKDSVEGQRASARLERAHGFTSDFRYRAALNGFAAALSPGQRAAIEADPEVAYVIPDQKLDAVGFVPLAAGESVPTGVQRIGAATPTTAHEASVANVAVIDTGIDLSTQPELNAVDGTNCVAPGTPAQDDNGHGTLVAGVIGAKNDSTVGGIVGVAPGTKIYAVKVLDANGSGSTAGVICGIDWVTANAAALGIKAVN